MWLNGYMVGFGFDYLFWQIVVFVFGLAIGSFLNVVIDRLPQKKSIVRGRSTCDFCYRKLVWWELVPVFSFIILRGRCRTCQGKLSWQYPLVELLTGLVSFLVMFFSPTSPLSVYLLVFVFALVVISVIDLKLGIIAEKMIVFLLSLFAIGSLFFFIYLFFVRVDALCVWSNYLVNRVLTAVLAALFFYLLVLVTKGRGMGGGDVMLAFVIGLFLTNLQTFLAVYLAFLIGGGVALILLLLGRKRFGQTLPFGPFLGIGAFIALLWSESILELYLTQGF